MGKVRKRLTSKEAQKAKMDDADGTRQEGTSTPKSTSSNNGLIIVLVIMIVLTWGIAATAYFGVVDYKGLMARGSEISSSDIAEYASVLQPFQYELAKHPLKTIGNFLMNIDDYVTDFFYPSEVFRQIVKLHRPLAGTLPINKEIKRPKKFVKRDAPKSESVNPKETPVTSSSGQTKKKNKEEVEKTTDNKPDDKDKARGNSKPKKTKSAKDSDSAKSKPDTVKVKDVAITLNIQLYVGDQPAVTERHLISENGTILSINPTKADNDPLNSKNRNKCSSESRKAIFYSTVPLNKRRISPTKEYPKKVIQKQKNQQMKLKLQKTGSKLEITLDPVENKSSNSKKLNKESKHTSKKDQVKFSSKKNIISSALRFSRKSVEKPVSVFIPSYRRKNWAARLKFLNKYPLRKSESKRKTSGSRKMALLSVFSKKAVIERSIAEDKLKIRNVFRKIAQTTPLLKHSGKLRPNIKPEEAVRKNSVKKIFTVMPRNKNMLNKRIPEPKGDNGIVNIRQIKVTVHPTLHKGLTGGKKSETVVIRKDKKSGRKITIFATLNKGGGIKRSNFEDGSTRLGSNARKVVIRAPLNKRLRRVVVFGKLNRPIAATAPIDKKKNQDIKVLKVGQKRVNSGLNIVVKRSKRSTENPAMKIVSQATQVHAKKNEDIAIHYGKSSTSRTRQDNRRKLKVVHGTQAFSKMSVHNEKVENAGKVKRTSKFKVQKLRPVIAAPIPKVTRRKVDSKLLLRAEHDGNKRDREKRGVVENLPVSKVLKYVRDIIKEEKRAYNAKFAGHGTDVVTQKSTFIRSEKKEKRIDEPKTPKAKLKKKLARMFDRTYDLISTVVSIIRRANIIGDIEQRLPESVKKFITEVKKTEIGSKFLDIAVNTTLNDVYRFTKKNGVRILRFWKEKWDNFYEFIQKKPSYKVFVLNLSKFAAKMQRKFNKLSTLLGKHFIKLQNNQKLLTSALITLSVIGLYSLLNSCFHAVLHPPR